MSYGWYPPESDYYVPAPEPANFPVRQGDLMTKPASLEQKDWVACQIVHPSCEIVAKKTPAHLHVIGVLPLSALEPSKQVEVAQGWKTVEGTERVAMAYTFFLPPAGELNEPSYSNFREVVKVPREQLGAEFRIAALTHDARVFFIRRKLYWEQRWALNLEYVRQFEADRIGKDPRFVGEKPGWAVA